MAARRSSWFCGRRLHERRGRAEGHDRDPRMGRMLFDEGLRGGLRGREAVRIDVLGAHAERHVHRQHDGLLLRRQGDDGSRTRDRDDRCDQRQQEQQRRDVPAELPIGTERILHQAQACVPDGAPSSAAAAAGRTRRRAPARPAATTASRARERTRSSLQCGWRATRWRRQASAPGDRTHLPGARASTAGVFHNGASKRAASSMASFPATRIGRMGLRLPSDC